MRTTKVISIFIALMFVIVVPVTLDAKKEQIEMTKSNGAHAALSDSKGGRVIDELCINTTKKDLEFAYTNKEYGHYTGETGKENRRKWQGLVIRCTSYVNNFIFKLGNADETGNLRDDALIETAVYPDRLVRTYRVHNGATQITEEIFMPDGLDVLIVRYSTSWSGTAYFYPHFDIRPHYWDKPSHSYSYHWNSSSSAIFASHADSPGCVVLKCGSSATFEETNFGVWDGFISKTYPKDSERGDSGIGEAFQPGALVVSISSNVPVTFAFSVANDETNAISNASYALANADALRSSKRARLTSLLDMVSEDNGNFSTDDAQFNKALKWALVSMDSLIMNAFGKGIAAGLHWFAEYWGRDMFISFPGAVLVTGKYDDAKAILSTACRIQDTNPSSPTYGRIPNRLNLGETVFNTADGTPWFIREFYEYVRYTGDVQFAKDNFATIKTAIAGEKVRMDAFGFSKHGDQDTWMDGIRNGDICSPRGDRAVEIQALWYAALCASSRIAEMLGNVSESAEWAAMAAQLKTSFNSQFWNALDDSLFDHINANNTKDIEKRPNEALAVSVPFEPLLSDDRELDVVLDVAKYCVVPWGVRSLSNQTHGFYNEYLDVGLCNAYACNGIVYYHPYHDYGTHDGLDHHDWSYHNGDVWHWLSGPVITSMAKHGMQDDAYNLTSTLTHHLLEGLTLGSLCEIMDGDSSGNIYGWDKGTISQAWSLAEYIRTFYQSYLGITPDLTNNSLVFEPALPNRLGNVTATMRLGNGTLKAHVSSDGTNMTLSTKGISESNKMNVTVKARIPPSLANVSSAELRVKVNGVNASFELHNRTFGRVAHVTGILYDDSQMNVVIYRNATSEQNQTQNQTNPPAYDRPPVAKFPQGQRYDVRAGMSNFISLNDKFEDPDLDALNFSVLHATNVTFVLHLNGTLEYCMENATTGELVINCSSNVSFVHWRVIINAQANRPPKLSSVVPLPGDKYDEGKDIIFMCVASDPDGDQVNVSWFALDGAVHTPIGNGTSFSARLAKGTYQVTIVATDRLGATTSASTSFEVISKQTNEHNSASYNAIFGMTIAFVVIVAICACAFYFFKRGKAKIENSNKDAKCVQNENKKNGE